MQYMVGNLIFFLVVAALIGGAIWAVVVMRKPRPPVEGENEDEW